jgi:uncharacterized protein (UPF0548 family)
VAEFTYDAIGATRGDTPAGFRSLDRRARIGSGDARWQFATAEAMRWGIFTRAGFRVRGGEIAVGNDAVLHGGIGPFRSSAPVRIVYTIDEPTRRGYAFGTLPGHPLRGEELFVVERADDDSVWLRIRSFSRPAGPLWWATYPVLRVVQSLAVGRYLRSLAGPIS